MSGGRIVVAALVFADVGGQVALRPNAVDADGSSLFSVGDGCIVYVTHGED